MSERIDHAAEAVGWLDYSGDQSPDADGKAMHAVALAQVHATLALVEQRRIANLIAWGIGAVKHAPGSTDEAAVRDIRAALGLTEGGAE